MAITTYIARHDPLSFHVGDKVYIARDYATGTVDGWSADWNADMTTMIGSTYVITDVVSTSGYELGSYFFPSCSLDLVSSAVPAVPAPSTYTHVSGVYNIGDVVEVACKIECAVGWNDTWDSGMDATVGKTGLVANAEPELGYLVEFAPGDPSYWYPSPALRASSGGTMIATPTVAPKAKRKRRIGPGPWDQAPCPHLRWHLMGFFRERLAVVKSSVDVVLKDGTSVAVEVASVRVTCTKCQTEMTLNAK